MSGQPPGEGEALALSRQLRAERDPYALYAALSDGGRRANTLLFERLDGPTLLLDSAAVRAECRGLKVLLTALSEGGRNALAALAERLQHRLVERDPDRLCLHFPENRAVDAEERLMAPSPFDAIRQMTTGLEAASSDEPFTLTCLGVIAYDHVDLFETLPSPAEDPLGFPDYVFWLAETLIVFEPGAKPRVLSIAFGARQDEEAKRGYFGASERLADLVARCDAASSTVDKPALPGVADFSDVDLDDDAYAAVVARMKEFIAAGEVYQIVPSRTFRAPCPEPLRSYAAIRQLDRSPYQFFVSGGDYLLFGASPETSVRVYFQNGRRVEVKPIAGTRPRGANDDEDDRLEAEMRLDAKEVAEHMMLVDLARNDVARISIPGTRRVAQLMSVERYARVMHLVSSVTGILKIGLDPISALQACLNVGTLTGAPKIRATELLRQTERGKRGPYGGAIGWINGDRDMDTAVVIRSAVVKDGIGFVRVGAGVVYDSDPEAETEETRRKASAMLSVLAATGEAA